MFRFHIRCNHCTKWIFTADDHRLTKKELFAAAAKAGWIQRNVKDMGTAHFCPECKFLISPESDTATDQLRKRKQPIWRQGCQPSKDAKSAAPTLSASERRTAGR